MGNTLSYLHVFTQCIRTRQRNFKRETSQQLIDINRVSNDGFLYDDDSSDDDELRSQDDDDLQDEKVVFYKPKKKNDTTPHTFK